MLVLSVLSAILLVFVYIQIRLTVAPLKKIRDSLENIRTGESTKLAENFPKEIQQLADEVNTLIAYGSGMVERYRTFASNLAHALKTPLSVLRNEAAREATPLAATVKEKGDVMLALIDRNLARVKAAGTGNLLNARTEAFPVAEKIGRSFGKLYGKEVSVTGESSALFRGEEGDFYEILGNIIENACKHAKHQVLVSVITGNDLEISVEDDGKGIPQEERTKVLKRGTRLDETVPGTGIGLSITRDLVNLYAGKMTLGDAAIGGLKVVLTLPKGSKKKR
jgi:signal transduction histidine kinase